MDRLLPLSLLVLLCALIFWGMWAGWKGRQKRQKGTGVLAPVPDRYEDAESLLAVPGVYIATTRMGDWLDRIATNTLGVKAAGTLFIFEDAVVIARDGAQDLWVRASDILAVRTEAGMAGKFVEKNGLVMLSWDLNGTPVDTGFRTRFAADKKTVLATIQKIAPQALEELPAPSA